MECTAGWFSGRPSAGAIGRPEPGWAARITGSSGGARSAITRAVETELRALGQRVERLDLDEARRSLTPASGCSDRERAIVHRALGYLAAVLVETGALVLIDDAADRHVCIDSVRDAVPGLLEVRLVDRSGAEGPGVQLSDELAPAPALVVETGAQSAGESVARIVGLIRDRTGALTGERRASGPPSGPGWAIWITGRPGSGKSTLSAQVAERLAERGVEVRLLAAAPVESRLLGERAAGEREQDIVHRVLGYSAKLLTEVGVSVIVDATAGRRAWRDAARALVPCFAEIQLLCPMEVCLQRERAVRWGLTVEAPPPRPTRPRPDIALEYEESTRPELIIRTDVCDVRAAVESVLQVVGRLARSPSRG